MVLYVLILGVKVLIGKNRGWGVGVDVKLSSASNGNFLYIGNFILKVKCLIIAHNFQLLLILTIFSK